jgi:phage tail tape-measure protein
MSKDKDKKPSMQEMGGAVAGGVAGGLVGQEIGKMAGNAFIPIPFVGEAIGKVAGGIAGAALGSQAGGAIGKNVAESQDKQNLKRIHSSKSYLA